MHKSGAATRHSFCLVLLALLTGCAATPYGPTTWPQYRLQPNHNAVFDNKAKPLPMRSFHTANEVRTTPVVVGNELLVGNHGSGDLFSFDLDTTAVRWHAKADNWIHSEMIATRHRIFVGYGNRDWGSNPLVRGTGKSGILALSRHSGKILWNFPTPGEAMPTPVVHRGVVYAATGDAHLYALDQKNGKQLWRLELPGLVSMSSPNLFKERLYMGGMNTVFAVDLPSRKVAWVWKEGGTFTDVPPAVADNGYVIISGAKGPKQFLPDELRQYGATAQHRQFLYAFAPDGRLVWKVRLGEGERLDHNSSGAPTVEGERIYVGSPFTNQVTCHDLHTGRTLWVYQAGAKVKGAPAVSHGRVYVGDGAGRVHVLDAAKGTLLGQRFLAKGPLLPAGPVIINDTLFIGSHDGYVYAMPVQDLVTSP